MNLEEKKEEKKKDRKRVFEVGTPCKPGERGLESSPWKRGTVGGNKPRKLGHAR